MVMTVGTVTLIVGLVLNDIAEEECHRAKAPEWKFGIS